MGRADGERRPAASRWTLMQSGSCALMDSAVGMMEAAQTLSGTPPCFPMTKKLKFLNPVCSCILRLFSFSSSHTLALIPGDLLKNIKPPPPLPSPNKLLLEKGKVFQNLYLVLAGSTL